MTSNVIGILLSLASICSAGKQAKAMLSYIESDSLSRHETRVGLDKSGKLWVIDNYRGKVQVTRIRPNGKMDPLKVAVYEASRVQLGSQVIFDAFNTLCFVLAGGEIINDKTPLNLFQVTEKGEVRNYDIWPIVPFKRNYLERLAGDTILILGGAVNGEILVSKGILAEDSVVPAYDTSYIMEDISLLNIGSQRDYYRSVLDWYKGWGLRADIQWYKTHEEVGPDKLTLTRMGLGADGDFSMQTLGTYTWRDYVWRTYRDAWIRYMTFTRYKDGGYVLAIPDPLDRPTTYLLRLDDKGEPIDPSTLASGGELSPLAFRRLPAAAEPHVDISMWGRIEQKPDSAHVIFWGCDNKGNLYAYRKVQVY